MCQESGLIGKTFPIVNLYSELSALHIWYKPEERKNEVSRLGVGKALGRKPVNISATVKNKVPLAFYSGISEAATL